MKGLKWLFIAHSGRYVLGIILLLTGVFSEYSTIGIIATDWVIFEITSTVGGIILVVQFLYHCVRAIIHEISD